MESSQIAKDAFKSFIEDQCARRKISLSELRWGHVGGGMLLRGSFETESDAYSFANEKFCKEISGRSKEFFGAEDYPLLKVYMEYEHPKRHTNPIKYIYQVFLHPAKEDIQFRGRLKGGSLIPPKFKTPDPSYLKIVFRLLTSNLDVLSQGLAPIDVELFKQSVVKTELSKKELKNILACYRNLIDAWKRKELNRDERELHTVALAILITWYVEGERHRHTVTAENYSINTNDYILRQLAHPDYSNNFLLDLNMRFGDLQ